MFRTDLWVSAFVRRHNDLGHMCVISRRGDALAGQIFIELDHLNGECSLFTPAPAATLAADTEQRVFQLLLDHVEPLKVRDRIGREEEFDPDLWVVSLEMRGGELGLELSGR